MSSSSATHASLPSSTSSGATSTPPSHDPRFAIVGAVLGTVGLILFIGVIIVTLRVRRREMHGGEKSVGAFHGTAVLDKNHPAARIIPFGALRTEGHTFRHIPGKDMRIAIRRPDGAWDFTDPSEPFTPSGISDVCPSPASSTTYLIPSSSRKKGPPADTATRTRSVLMDYKEQESRAAKLIRLGYDARDGSDDLSDMPLPHPPPAYGHEPTVGPYVTFRPSGSQAQVQRGTSSRYGEVP